MKNKILLISILLLATFILPSINIASAIESTTNWVNTTNSEETKKVEKITKAVDNLIEKIKNNKIKLLKTKSLVSKINSKNNKVVEQLLSYILSKVDIELEKIAIKEKNVIIWKTVDNDLFSIEMPETWKEIPQIKEDRSWCTAERPCFESVTKTFDYSSDDGNYFRIVVDMEDMWLPTVDQYWSLKSNSSWDWLVITDIYIDYSCSGCYEDQEPSIGDGSMSIRAFDKEGKTINGHSYIFFFGNEKKEKDVDTKVYKKILESLRTK